MFRTAAFSAHWHTGTSHNFNIPPINLCVANRASLAVSKVTRCHRGSSKLSHLTGGTHSTDNRISALLSLVSDVCFFYFPLIDSFDGARWWWMMGHLTCRLGGGRKGHDNNNLLIGSLRRLNGAWIIQTEAFFRIDFRPRARILTRNNGKNHRERERNRHWNETKIA